MMTETATVIAFQNGIATVQSQGKTTCSGCSSKAGCGNSALSELSQFTTKQNQYIFTLKSPIPLVVGQQVLVGLEEKSLLISALIVYILPLLVLLTTALISATFITNEGIIAFLTLAMTLISFLPVGYFSRKIKNQAHYQPKLLKAL